MQFNEFSLFIYCPTFYFSNFIIFSSPILWIFSFECFTSILNGISARNSSFSIGFNEFSPVRNFLLSISLFSLLQYSEFLLWNVECEFEDVKLKMKWISCQSPHRLTLTLERWWTRYSFHFHLRVLTLTFTFTLTLNPTSMNLFFAIGLVTRTCFLLCERF